jgi:hypothetical protein
MNEFVKKHCDKVTGTLSCFDRVLFKGYLPICYAQGMMKFLNIQGILFKDFKPFVLKQAERIKAHAQTMARRNRRPYRYLSGYLRKEDVVRDILRDHPLSRGLVCILSAVEPCQSFKLAYGQGRPRLVAARRKCLCLYFYFLDHALGLMHVRIQTWFPFTIQVCVNGHQWLARKMHRHQLPHRHLHNAFIWLQHPTRAQRFADGFPRMNWPRILMSFARRACPLFADLLAHMQYYWVVDQAEYATDVLFKDRASLKELYQRLLNHATLCFSAEDVLSFLGRKLHGNFTGEVLNDCKKRWPGARVKHRMKENWIKMYDKHGLVLRIETVINHPYEFKIRRLGKRQGQLRMGWYPMAKGVANLYRYAQVAAAANHRYLQALSVVDDPSAACCMLEEVCQPARYRGRRRRGLHPLRKDDLTLFAAALRGEHAIHGFRNCDLAKHLCLQPSNDPAQKRRHSARVTRLIQLLRAHRLIAKIPRARRYRITLRGHTLMTAALHLRHDKMPTVIDHLAA